MKATTTFSPVIISLETDEERRAITTALQRYEAELKDKIFLKAAGAAFARRLSVVQSMRQVFEAL